MSDRIPSSTHAFVFSFGDFIRETDASVRVERVGRAAQAKIVQASIP